MTRTVVTLLAICHLLVFNIWSVRAEQPVKPVFVHYMPWYTSKDVGQNWGWHWTMNHFDPEKRSSNGKREIASHYYPVVGPYDSSDPDLIQYHMQLMKLAGIDGVIIDWYGIDSFQDFGVLHKNTLAIVEQAVQANLKFGICYEDQSLKQMAEKQKIDQASVMKKATDVFQFLDKNWFSHPSYLRINDQPVLLVFGPQFFQIDQWKSLTSTLANKPLLYGLPHLSRSHGFDGKYGWPPVSGNKEITPAKWKEYLNALEKPEGLKSVPVSVAFPGFRDIYQQAGLHDSYGSIDHRDGKTFDESFLLAQQSSSQIIQIATWNDFGEGTMVEPTEEFGYRFLEAIQKYKNRSDEELRLRTSESLRLPAKLYLRKKELKGRKGSLEGVRQIDQLLNDVKTTEARQLLGQ